MLLLLLKGEKRRLLRLHACVSKGLVCGGEQKRQAEAVTKFGMFARVCEMMTRGKSKRTRPLLRCKAAVLLLCQCLCWCRCVSVCVLLFGHTIAATRELLHQATQRRVNFARMTHLVCPISNSTHETHRNTTQQPTTKREKLFL